MFSHFFQSGSSIELYNANDKWLLSNWKFIGRYSKVYDRDLKNFMHILDTGSLSKMELPKTSSTKRTRQSLGIFQSYIVFQIYLFSTKQFSIEISISDTAKTNRRLIFSTNNKDLVFNQLHCRIPLLNVPIGKWTNYSIDILSFVSECFKDLTFRSIDYISLSMSGKVREIFTMRNPLICSNIVNESFAVFPPEKFDFPPNSGVVPENINMNCNKVITQILLENQINSQKQIIKEENMDEKDLDLSMNQHYKERYYPRRKGKENISSNISKNNISNISNRLICNNNRFSNFGSMIIDSRQKRMIHNKDSFLSKNQNKEFFQREMPSESEFVAIADIGNNNLSNAKQNEEIENDNENLVKFTKVNSYKYFNKEEYTNSLKRNNGISNIVQRSFNEPNLDRIYINHIEQRNQRNPEELKNIRKLKTKPFIPKRYDDISPIKHREEQSNTNYDIDLNNISGVNAQELVMPTNKIDEINLKDIKKED